MSPVDAPECAELEWDHDILSEQAERDWEAFQRDVEADWRL